MNSDSVRITFCGGTGTVTGANFLVEVADKKILVDCGLEQGTRFADSTNREAFSYDPASVQILLVTHAHADHIGRIPKLVKDGFSGTIYSTPATYELASVMLPDTLSLLEEEARRNGELPLYEEKDMARALALWKTVPYHSFADLGGIGLEVKDSGHILGAAMYELIVKKSDGREERIVFTGDLGNSPSLFLRDTDKLTDATYLIMESVYGDRNHEPKAERKAKLTDIIKDTVARKRTLLIPAFSLERTQDILYEINDLVERGEIPATKVFIDSPLATRVTEIYKKYTKDFNEGARDIMAQGDDLFDFPKLKFVMERDESERIARLENPKIIIAGSGMSNGGRIVRHERHFLPDSNTTLLLAGYQAIGTLGRQIQDGAKKVFVDGEKVKVKAKVEVIEGYSSHKDTDHLVDFVADTAPTLKKVFVTMGEPKASLFLVQRLRDYLNIDAVCPAKGETVVLE